MKHAVVRPAFLLAPLVFLALTGAAQVAPVPAAAPAPRPAFLRVGLGPAYDIDNYYRCARLTAEYVPMLTRHLGLASRVAAVVGRPPGNSLEAQLPRQNYRAVYLEQEAVFYPLGTDKRVLLGLGGGGFVGYYRKNTFDFLQGNSGQVTDFRLTSRGGIHAGYLFSLSVEVGLGQQQRWLLGAKSTFRNGIGGNTTATHSLTIGRRL